MKRVVVTGMGAITPIGNNVKDYWNNIKEGVSGAAEITYFDTTKFKTKFACEVKGFNTADFFDRKEARKYDKFTQFALVAADEAIVDSGAKFEELDTYRIGVIWGSGNGGMQTFQDEVTAFAKGDGTPRFSPFLIPKTIVDIAAGVISIKHGLHGVNFATVSACATSTTAMIEAFNHIKWGKADMIVSGGSDAAITESGIGGFSSLKALSTRNEDPKTASRPFDVNRDGFVMGEGAGAIILEEYEHAIKRGAKIYAEVVGGGQKGDAYHLTGTHPEGLGAQLGMKEALDEAGITPDEVDYINMHATSTPIGDPSELIGIEKVFGKRDSLSLSGTKSMTGHLLGAAGAIEAIATIKALQEDIVPPTINVEEIDEFAKGFEITVGKAQKKKINYALSNTFGFGGHVATVLIKKYKE
ncbi:MAG: 3-oxoacyl-[acyl-carrier-protein] synthase II [Flavobacteriales bacterium]|jgi:3-oxoacyl-[acyl-carrier-protein] synthase II|tara:strand:- start:17543 stop:18784 length:1242 start_codon:yes stop_codon:yes gene_type:complete